MEHQMITEIEVEGILHQEFPEMSPELKKEGRNIFKVLHCLAGYTQRCAETGNLLQLKSCLEVAEKLLCKGNQVVKAAVENVFVFSISPLLERVSPVRETVKGILPHNLQNAYLEQIRPHHA